MGYHSITISTREGTFLCYKYRLSNTTMLSPSILARTAHMLMLFGHRHLSKNCFFSHDRSSKWGQLWWRPIAAQSSHWYKATPINRGHKCPRNTLSSWQSLSVICQVICLYTGSCWLLWAATANHGAQSHCRWLLHQAMKNHLWVAARGCTAQAASAWEMEASRIPSRSFNKVPASLSYPFLPTTAG